MFDWLDTVRIDLPQPQHENPTVTMREGKS
jgi:hypothetical protein